MKYGGGFSIVLIMAGGMLILVMMMGKEPWLNAPKAVASATVSNVISCDNIENDRICTAKITRIGKLPQIWTVKLQNEYGIITAGQSVHKMCWFELSSNQPICFENAILKPVGPWRNSRKI
jgi:hypothetical protein